MLFFADVSHYSRFYCSDCLTKKKKITCAI